MAETGRPALPVRHRRRRGAGRRFAARQPSRSSARAKITVPQLLWVWVRVKRASRSGTRVIQSPKPSWNRISAAIAQCSSRVTAPQPSALSRRRMALFRVISSRMRIGSTAGTSGRPPVEPKAVRSISPVRSNPASKRSGWFAAGPKRVTWASKAIGSGDAAEGDAAFDFGGLLRGRGQPIEAEGHRRPGVGAEIAGAAHQRVDDRHPGRRAARRDGDGGSRGLGMLGVELDGAGRGGEVHRDGAALPRHVDRDRRLGIEPPGRGAPRARAATAGRRGGTAARSARPVATARFS